MKELHSLQAGYKKLIVNVVVWKNLKKIIQSDKKTL